MLPKGSIQDKLFQQLRWNDKMGFMGATYKARFTNGVLKPLEKVDLKEGEEVVFMKKDSGLDGQLERKDPERAARALKETAGAWADSIDCEELERVTYEARLRGSRH